MSRKTETTAYDQLSPKRQRFVDEYVVDFNGTQAATRAGYSPKSAQEQAARLLSNAIVRAAVEERRKSIKRKSVNHRHWLLRKTKKIIDKCTDDGSDKWNPQGANGAVKNMVDILGLKTEKHEISGGIQVSHDLSKLSAEDLHALLKILERAK